MKVSRDGKGDVGKGGTDLPGGESGVLFPRLHVKETKADGPRAPPRNKMALYEQFSVPSQRFAASGNGAGNKMALYEQLSIPSHRFFQPGRQNPAMTNQPASCDGRFMYAPYYVSPHAYTGVSYPGHFLGQNLMSSSNSTATESDKLTKCDLAKGTEQSSRVASYSTARAPKVHCNENENPFSSNVKNAEDLTTQASTKLNNSDVTDHGTKGGLHIQEGLQITNIPPQVDSHVKHPDQSCGPVIENDGTEMKERETEFCNDSIQSPCDDTYCTNDIQCLQKHSNEGDQSRLENEDNYQSKNSSTSDNVADSKGFNLLSNSRECQVSVDQSHGSKEPSKSISGCVESQYSGENVSGDVDKDMDGCQKNEKSQKPECERDKYKHYPCNDLQNSLAVSGHHENENDDSCDHNSDSSMVDSLHACDITPKNVIDAIGQREFWRVRKAILRQQKIFSTQVFELHRLVKVQKLIATASNILEDNVYENLPVSTSEEQCVPTVSPQKCLKSSSIHVDHDCEIITDKVKPSNKEMAADSGISTHQPASENVEPVAHDPRDRLHAGEFPAGTFLGSASAWGYPAYMQNPCAVATHPGCYGGYHQYPMNQFGVSNAVFGIPYSLEGSASGPQNLHGCQHQCKCSAENQTKVMGNFPKYPSPDGLCYNSITPVPYEPLTSTGNLRYPVPDAGRSVANVSGKEVSKGSFRSESVMKQSKPVSSDKSSNGYHSQDSTSQVSVRKNDRHLVQTEQHVLNSKKRDTVSNSSVSLSEQKQNDKEMWKNRFNSLNWTLSEEVHEYPSANEDVADVPDTVDLENQVLSLFPLSSSFSCSSETKDRSPPSLKEQRVTVIKAVPRAAMAASESTADILLSLQRERQQ